MKNHRMPAQERSRGSALVIVLAFLFLLTVVSIAFLARAVLERQLSNASLNQNKIDLVAQGATASIIADLQQESQVAGTIVPPVVGFTPATPPPATDGLEDLLQVSTTGRASGIDTVTSPSLNNRSGGTRLFCWPKKTRPPPLQT
jgi:Tfp pilus assembly protein PilX